MRDFIDTFLPNQSEQRKHTHWNSTLLFNFVSTFNGFKDYSDLKLEVPENMPVEEMASNPITIALLQFLIKSVRPSLVLELGSYIGISAIKMAQVMKAGSFICTVEKGDDFAALANKNINNNIITHVSYGLIHDDALTTVKRWVRDHAHPDFVFLDADKEHYDEYLDPIDIILRPGGVLVVDDVFFHGDALNEEPTTDKGRGCKRLLEKAKKLPWPKVLLPLANGILIMQKPL